MQAIRLQQLDFNTIALSAVGVAVALLTRTPFGLLVPALALWLVTRHRAGLLLSIACASGLVGSLLAAALYEAEASDLAAMWAGFFALAICIGTLVATRTSAPAGAEPKPRALAVLGRDEPRPYPGLGPTYKEKAAPRDSPIVSIATADDQDTAARIVAASFWGGTPFHIRYWKCLTGGSYRWTEIRTEALRDPGGTQRWSGLHAEIDDPTPTPPQPTKMAFNPPHETDAVQAAKVVERLLGNAWAFDAAGRPIYLTPIGQTFVAVTLEEFQAEVDKGHTIFKKTCHPDEYDRIAEAWQHSLRTGDHFHIERRIRRATGIYDWSRTAIVPTRNDHGRITGWYGGTIDLDAHRNVEAELRNRQRELSQIVDMVPSLLWRLDPHGEPTFFNKRMIDFLGLDVTDCDQPGRSRLEVIIEAAIHPDDAASFKDNLIRGLATGEPLSMRYRMRRADGVDRWMSGRAEPMRDDRGRIVQWFGLSHDIDDQMRLYSELEEREAKIRRLVDSDIIGIVIWDLDGRLIDANDAFLHMVQCEREDLQAGLRWFDMTPPEWQEAHARYEAEELRATGVMQAREKEFFRKDGTRVPVLIGAACFEGQSGQGVAYILDLTERKRAEMALRDRGRELSQLVDMLPIHITRLSPEGETIFFNKRFKDFAGTDLAELRRRGLTGLAGTVQAIVHPDDAGNVQDAIRRSLATGEGYAAKYRARRADGVYRWLDGRGEPVRNGNGTIAQWYAISIDIDDEVRAQQAEEALRRTSDKLVKATQAASLAELSASIAHEVNQPLAAIVANSHACQRWLGSNPPNFQRAQIVVERIVRDANSAAEVVSRIRALFKQTVEPRNATTISSIIAEARRLMAEDATRRRVRIDEETDSDLPVVVVDRVQIQQVLINLIGNGMDAMDASAGERVLKIRVRRNGRAVQVDIIDHGPGIDFPDKIFEPFFTTKAQGMGMGLAICRSIVEAHGGRLWGENIEPHGASFSFTLPAEEKSS